MITQERLKQVVTYNDASGEFTWNLNTRTTKIGRKAGSIDKDGYVVIGVDGKQYFAHRLAWLYVYSAWPNEMIDHINHIKTDNRIENLRDLSNSLNGQNRLKAQSNNRTSGLLGASWHKANKRWRSTIHIGGRQVFLGQFDTAMEAHNAYLAAKRIHHAGCTI